jgi:hypothetical protein
MVTGRLRQRSWETPEGDKRSVTEIEADEVGASLKWATAKVERTSQRGNDERTPGRERQTERGDFNDPPPLGCQKSVPGVRRRCDSRAMVRRRVLSSRWRCGWSGRLSTWLRRVPELMVLAGGRWTPGRWRSWSSVTSWPSCAASTHGLGSRRALLAALSRLLPRPRWSIFMVTPEMRLGWHRRMVGRRWTYPAQARGQPLVPQQVQSLICGWPPRTHGGANSASAGSCWALAAGSPPAPSPGFLRANGLPRGATLASLAPADPAVPQLHWSRRGQGVECTTLVPLDYDRPDPAFLWVRR